MTIPPVPVRLRLVLAVPLVVLAIGLKLVADWIVPEMADDPTVQERKP